jgi:hypothetical protein
MPKGNYYLFSPLVDEKGERVVREERADDWVETEGPLSIPPEPFHVAEPEGCTVRLLTMKKFDHDPFADLIRIHKKIMETECYPGFQESKELWDVVRRLVKELEAKDV